MCQVSGVSSSTTKADSGYFNISEGHPIPSDCSETVRGFFPQVDDAAMDVAGVCHSCYCIAFSALKMVTHRLHSSSLFELPYSLIGS